MWFLYDIVAVPSCFMGAGCCLLVGLFRWFGVGLVSLFVLSVGGVASVFVVWLVVELLDLLVGCWVLGFAVWVICSIGLAVLDVGVCLFVVYFGWVCCFRFGFG